MLQEDWEREWKDYYLILGVDRNATQEEIKRAYHFYAQRIFPDKVEDSFAERANEEAKKFNEAYSYLKDPQKREQYNLEWDKRKQSKAEDYAAGQNAKIRPKPVVDSPIIDFGKVEPGEIKKEAFTITNQGGNFKKIRVDVDTPDSWVKVVDSYSMDVNNQVPFKVEIEAEGKDWNQSYIEYITVRLDEEETNVRVTLQTISKPETGAKVESQTVPHINKYSNIMKPSSGKKNYIWPIFATMFILICIIYIITLLNNANSAIIQSDPTNNRLWNGTYPQGWFTSAQQTSDGGYIATGETRSWVPNKVHLWLVKTDANGNKQWDKSFGGLDDDWGHSVQQTNDGGYIIVGTTFSYGAGRDDAWLIKTDASGNKQWDKTFGGIGQDWGTSIQQTIDGGYILLMVSDNDILLIKTDSNGNRLWSKTFGKFGEYDCQNYGYFVQQTNDGGYILVGSTCSSDSASSRTRDAWLIKTDIEGNELWDRTFGGPGYDEGYSIRQTSDGSYILVGYTLEETVYGSWKESDDVWLIKTDAYGNKLWNRPLGINSPCTILSGNSLWKTRDNGYITIGRHNGSVSLIKTDVNGNKQWDRSFWGSGRSCGKSVQQTSDGGYIIAGGLSNANGHSEDNNAWLIKTDPNGNI